MSGVPAELHFLLDGSGAMVVFQEKGASWAGVLAFSTEEKAWQFCRDSNLEAKETAAIASADPEAIAQLVNTVKRRTVRYLLLDLDYRTGGCIQVEFEGDRLGAAAERQLTPQAPRN